MTETKKKLDLELYKTPWGIDALDIEDKEARSKIQARNNLLNKHISSCFSTKSGKIVLNYLTMCTVDQPTWIPTEGNYGVHNSFVREGQNSIVRNIINRIKKAKEAK